MYIPLFDMCRYILHHAGQKNGDLADRGQKLSRRGRRCIILLLMCGPALEHCKQIDCTIIIQYRPQAGNPVPQGTMPNYLGVEIRAFMSLTSRVRLTWRESG
jgi:hypothetical protein